MDTDRARMATVAAAGDALPIDAETISATISRALRLGSGRPDLGALAELEEELRGHVAALLPVARASAQRLWPSSIEAHRLTARLDGIERQAELGPAVDVFTAHVQVQLLARDCQWLLTRYTAEAR
ncbi:DUF6415 family natural product biosynthesis protein [Streptomyces sp. NRRL S-337]|uniref:DUF6415 family natural product biosynthesis protein n=1 Tax=Streptomyces sp. NRRL S-337 TaxID=1463900 RepID=UPI00131E56C2|nr:DUF6415 family natural product biosynthesis protein [Streptomyces sp. NRRL S-337]